MLVPIAWIVALCLAGITTTATLPVVVAIVGSGFGLTYGTLYLRRQSDIARSACTDTCQGPGWAVAYSGWDGSVHTFILGSNQFALSFMRANDQKLVNVSHDTVRGLQAPALASSPDPPSSPSKAYASSNDTSSRSEDEFVLRAISSIESFKGPAARRSALEIALKGSPSDEVRQRLLLAASRIEVQATLDKVDQLKTTAAKRRHLNNAISAIQNDPLADELQKTELAQLHDALAELDATEK